MDDHKKLPRLGKVKKEVLLSLHIYLGAIVEDDFPLAPDELPVRLYSAGVFVEDLLTSMSGTRHYLRPLDGMMLEVAPDKLKAEYERLYNEWQYRQWYGPELKKTEDLPPILDLEETKNWRTSALSELRDLDRREMSVKGSVKGSDAEIVNYAHLRSSKAWEKRWGSLEASCYAALKSLKRDRLIWRKRFKPENRVNEVMKIGLTMKGLQLSRTLMEKAFSEYAVKLREGFTKAGLPDTEHDKLIASFRLKFGLVRPVRDG